MYIHIHMYTQKTIYRVSNSIKYLFQNTKSLEAEKLAVAYVGLGRETGV